MKSINWDEVPLINVSRDMYYHRLSLSPELFHTSAKDYIWVYPAPRECFSKEDASRGRVPSGNRPRLRTTRSLPSYHDLESVPSLPSYPTLATIISPSVDPVTILAPTGDTSSSIEPPTENQVVRSQSDPVSNENIVFESSAPPE